MKSLICLQKASAFAFAFGGRSYKELRNEVVFRDIDVVLRTPALPMWTRDDEGLHLYLLSGVFHDYKMSVRIL